MVHIRGGMIRLTPKLIMMTVFITIVTVTIFTISHPVLAYYQDLPADHEANIPNIRWQERIKQSWSFMYTNLDEGVLEIGCGNTAVAHHLSKVLPSKVKHSVILTHDKNLIMPKSVNIYQNSLVEPIPFTVICHFEAQDFLKKNIIHIIPHANNLILEVSYATLKDIKPWLELYGFKKQRQYIFLSVWQKNAMVG